jgi:hypothetical protein
MWCLADIEVISTKTEVSDYYKQQFGINNSPKIKKQGDINQSAKIKRRLRNFMLPRSKSATILDKDTRSIYSKFLEKEKYRMQNILNN